ncbi:MAG: hypothetical protein KIT14_10145 [bacterium]|nr:hypothetical protein [bacterium]
MNPRFIVAACVLVAASAVGPAAAQTCGNGIVEPPEACDPPGSISCPAGSPGGAFQACAADCTCPAGDGALNAFQCYGARVGFRGADVELVDRFGSYDVSLRKVSDVCAPADVGSDDDRASLAAADPAHLTRYPFKTRQGETPTREQKMVNEFGTFMLDVGKPVALLVPTAKSLDGPPSPLGAFVDHFTCHRVKPSRGTARFAGAKQVAITTQFETTTIDLRKPRTLCAPTDKNGEDAGAVERPDHLLCFDVKGRGGIGRPAVFLDNQFGEQSGRMRGHRHEFCVPSNDGTVPTTTTTSSSTTSTLAPSTTTTSSTTSTTVAPSTTTTTVETTTTTVETTTTTLETTTTTLEPTTTTTSSTTTTTMYGSPGRAFLDPVRGLLD